MSEIVTAHPTQPGTMLAMIMEMATNPAVVPANLRELLNMQILLEDRQAVRTFNAALGRVSRQMPRVPKNGRIELGLGKGSIPFAKWDDMDKLIRPILDQEGFTLSFTSVERQSGGGLVVTGRLLHPDGHFQTADIPVPLDTGPGRNNIQAMGSTLSYGKRYAAEMLLNIVREGVDDDGATHGQKFITEEQAMQIETMLTETKSDRTAFMRLFKCEHNLLDMPAEVFVAAINALNMKKKKLEKAP